jgi:hypothetical protein
MGLGTELSLCRGPTPKLSRSVAIGSGELLSDFLRRKKDAIKEK